MANIDEEPKYACSASVQEMRDELADAPVTAYEIVAYLLEKHPEYAQGLAADLRLAQDGNAPQRPVDEWLGDVGELHVDRERLLDGRLIILGLALLIRDLQRALRRDDFLLILMVEYEPEYDSLLSPAGKDLFYRLFGRPRMEEPEEQAKGFDGPAAPNSSFGGELVDLEEAFESLESMPPMAGPVEMEEMETAVEESVSEATMPAEEEMFEAAMGLEPDEMPENGGEKGIEPEGPQEETSFTQARRLEAAMPEAVRVHETTELLVMLPRAQSEGLRAELPKETEAGEIIEKDDVKERGAELVFEAPDKPLTVFIAVDAKEQDFDIEDPVKKVKVYADRDGDYEIFYLMPLRATNRAPLQVRLYRDEALTDSVSTIRMNTKIEPPDVGEESDPQLAGIRRALAYASVPVNITIGDVITVGNITNASGVAIGRAAEAVVSRATTVSAFDITGLFTPLLSVVSSSAPHDHIGLVIGHVQALQVEIERGADASDPQIATLLQLIVEVVPISRTAVMELFSHPEINTAVGDVTRFVLRQIEQQQE